LGRKNPALHDLLGVPSQYAFAAMIPMGKPVKQLTKLSRKPVSEFAVLERFDGPCAGGLVAVQDLTGRLFRSGVAPLGVFFC
jgi:hypothetical protein